jgi:hypothetical protein
VPNTLISTDGTSSTRVRALPIALSQTGGVNGSRAPGTTSLNESVEMAKRHTSDGQRAPDNERDADGE